MNSSFIASRLGPTYVGKSLNTFGWILYKGLGGDTDSIKDERSDRHMTPLFLKEVGITTTANTTI